MGEPRSEVDPSVHTTVLTPDGKRASGDGYRSAVFRDRDGSVTGQAGRYVVVDNPFLLDRSAVRVPAWNAALSNAPYGRLFLDNKDAAPRAVGPVRITREDDAKPTYEMGGGPASGPGTSFQTTLIAGRDYLVRFHGRTPNHLRLTLRHREPGDWVRLALPVDARIQTAYLDRDSRAALAPAASKTVWATARQTCWFQSGKTLYVKLVVRPGSPRGAAALDVCSHQL